MNAILAHGKKREKESRGRELRECDSQKFTARVQNFFRYFNYKSTNKNSAS